MTDRNPDRATSERALRALTAARLPPYPGFDMAEALREPTLWPLPPPGADAAVDWQRAAAAVYEVLLEQARCAFVESNSYSYGDYDLAGNAGARGEYYCDALDIMKAAGYRDGFLSAAEEEAANREPF